MARYTPVLVAGVLAIGRISAVDSPLEAGNPRLVQLHWLAHIRRCRNRQWHTVLAESNFPGRRHNLAFS